MLLRQIISWARERHGINVADTPLPHEHHDTDVAATMSARKRRRRRVAVTASTGMAAVNIGGVTLHSWAGIGLGTGQPNNYVNTIKFGPGNWKDVRKRWKRVKTLIIDESNVRFL